MVVETEQSESKQPADWLFGERQRCVVVMKPASSGEEKKLFLTCTKGKSPQKA